MKTFARSLPGWLAAGVLFVVLPFTAVAQDPVVSHEQPPGRPAPMTEPDTPVATVNGVAVYPPLMRSAVSNAVDRALIIFDFSKQGLRLSQGDLDQAVAKYRRDQFQNNSSRLETRLRDLGATRFDYRQYVAEEVKINTVLNNLTQPQKAYLARLRANARISTSRN